MATPLIRSLFPILIASFVFAQTPAGGSGALKGDTLAPKHDGTVQAAKKKKATSTKPAVSARAAKSAKVAAVAPQTTCPVLGGSIDKTLFVNYRGKRIYVCCAGCLDAVKKDPAKYIGIIEKSGHSVEVIAKGKDAPAPATRAGDVKGSGMGSMKM